MSLKTKSLLGYSNRFLVSQLTKSLCTGDYESSCYWSVEMHSSGWLEYWYTTILSFCATYIHTSNPKIAKFLYKVSLDYPGLRGLGLNTNNAEIRQAIALIVGVCTFSPKDMALVVPKPIAMSARDEPSLFMSIDRTPLHIFVVNSALKGDPPFVMKLFSQLATCIDQNDFYGALRVLSLSLFFEKHRVYKKKMVCAARSWDGLSKKLQTHWYLFVWDVLVRLSQPKGLEEIIGSWRALYISSCEYSKVQSLCPYIINSIALLTHPVNLETPCIRNEHVIHKGCANIDYIYSLILKQFSRGKVKMTKSKV